LKRYQVAFKSDRPKIKEFSHQINELTRKNEYGIIDFKNGVILLQKNVPSKTEAMTAWQNYLLQLQPIIDSVE
jgi:hypothetical protein